MSLVLYRALLVTSCRLISDIFINLQSRIKQQTVINKQAGTILLGMGAIFSSTCIIFFKLVKPYGLSLVHAHHRLSSNTPGDQLRLNNFHENDVGRVKNGTQPKQYGPQCIHAQWLRFTVILALDIVWSNNSFLATMHFHIK